MEDYEVPIKVLDAGFVQYRAHLGNDDSIANDARVSYAKNTKKVRNNAGLVRYLMRHQHYSPFGQVQFKAHMKVPLFVFAQMVRHDRFVFNCESARYSVMSDHKWEPVAEDLRGQGQGGNKQVGDGDLATDKAELMAAIIQSHNADAHETYEHLLELGLSREKARTVLNVGQYTQFVVTASLGDWMLFLKQRLSSHAQYEIRVYAQAIEQILNGLFPVAMQAFRDYQLNAVTLSCFEIDAVADLINGALAGVSEEEYDLWLQEFIPRANERIEFKAKFNL
jgi:thymidylate synthase (FAD)